MTKIGVVYVYDDVNGVPTLDQTDQYHAISVPYETIERAVELQKEYNRAHNTPGSADRTPGTPARDGVGERLDSSAGYGRDGGGQTRG